MLITRTIASVLALSMAWALDAQSPVVNDWENPQVFEINKEPGHSFERNMEVQLGAPAVGASGRFL